MHEKFGHQPPPGTAGPAKRGDLRHEVRRDTIVLRQKREVPGPGGRPRAVPLDVKPEVGQKTGPVGGRACQKPRRDWFPVGQKRGEMVRERRRDDKSPGRRG